MLDRWFAAAFFEVLAACLIWNSEALAETYGPYFYRAGNPESYIRCETTLHLNGAKLVVDECAEHMHWAISQGARECWSQTYDDGEFSANNETIEFVSGDIERLDRRTRRYTIEDRIDHHIVVRNVAEQFKDWESTPASWRR